MSDKKKKKKIDNIEEEIVKILKKKDLTLVTAESCTGGLVTGKLVSVAGVSEVLLAGLITYSNAAKRKYLEVKKSTLKKYGAVSKQTAKEMAKGAALGNNADVSIAVTGIAGPDGGTEEKPVGLVYIGCYANENATVKEYKFSGTRDEIREQAVESALLLLHHCITEEYVK